jgi:hypothetical protein
MPWALASFCAFLPLFAFVIVLLSVVPPDSVPAGQSPALVKTKAPFSIFSPCVKLDRFNA